MKKLFLLALLALTPLARAEDPPPPKDQLTELYTKLGAVSPKVVKAGHTILHIEFERLSPGSDYSFRRELNSKFKYKLVAVGAPTIHDLRLRLIDAKGKVDASDPNSDSVAIVNFVPKSNGAFNIKIGAAKVSGDQAYFFCLVASKPAR
ncbi:hypothetical protein JST97_30880 [bacterium]|nr:hypothetical protein [bacterium]